jgi:hypothetical protein
MYLLLIVLAALLVAVADSLKNNFGNSIFSKLNENFWNPAISEVAAPKLIGIRWDAYNLSSMLAILVLIITGVVAQMPLFQIRFLPVFLQIIIAVVFFIVSYNYFYRTLLNHKS